MPAARERRHAERRLAPPRAAPVPSQASAQRGPENGRTRFERRTLIGLLALGAAIWIAVVFAGAMSEAGALEAQAATARRENEALHRRVVAGQQEIRFVQTAPFLALQARAFGYGLLGERLFALAPGAPSPPPIVALGSEPPADPARTIADELVSIVFGR